jgi:hypothetical protein
MRLIDDDRSPARSEFGKGLRVKGKKKGKGEEGGRGAHELSREMTGERTRRLFSGKRQKRR